MRLLAIAVGLLVAAALLWIASEMHYDNCVSAAEARGYRGDPTLENNEILNPGGEPRIAELVRGCSRLPF